MKKLALVLFIFNIAMISNAQSHWGIKVGVNNQKLAEEKYTLQNVPNYGELRVILKEQDYRIHAGLLYHFEIKKHLFFQPELLFSQSKYTYNINDKDQVAFIDKVLDERFNYLDIPIQVGIRIHPLQFGIGIVPQILLSSISELDEIDGFESAPDVTSMAFTAGAGIDILKTIKLEVRYENSNELLGREINIENEKYNFGSRAAQWLFSATIIF